MVMAINALVSPNAVVAGDGDRAFANTEIEQVLVFFIIVMIFFLIRFCCGICRLICFIIIYTIVVFSRWCFTASCVFIRMLVVVGNIVVINKLAFVAEVKIERL